VTPLPSIEGRPLFLIGFPGTGKSTVGPLLAARLARPFVDLDERIESEANATVAEIFATEGEPGFRRREAELVRRLCGEGPKVVALGGGAPCHGDNLARLLAAGVVVGLSATLEEILARVGDASTRPLLAGATDKRAEVERLLEARSAFYRRAHLSVDTGGLAPSAVVSRVLEELSGC
jgi:shikimate kinase